MTRDSEADFRGWVAARRGGLRQTAFLLCGDWFLADDLVQEALTRLFSVWPRVARSGDPHAYVYRILVNLNTDHRRRPGRREISHGQVDDARGKAVTGVADNDHELLIAALRRIPDGQRSVLLLRFCEDLSVEQTAAALGTSTGNVKSQSSRGLRALRAALAEGQPHPRGAV